MDENVSRLYYVFTDTIGSFCFFFFTFCMPFATHPNKKIYTQSIQTFLWIINMICNVAFYQCILLTYQLENISTKNQSILENKCIFIYSKNEFIHRLYCEEYNLHIFGTFLLIHLHNEAFHDL